MGFLRSDFLRTLGVRTALKSQHDSSGSVFLSHSSKDLDLLPGVVLFLEIYGAKVYVDERDHRMPKPPSSQTARLLKRMIATSSKFIVLISEKSSSSKWVPWELGLADGLCRLNNIALLPTSETGLEEMWAQQEYLGLYSKIKINEHGNYIVHDPEKNTQIELGQWLSMKQHQKELA